MKSSIQPEIEILKTQEEFLDLKMLYLLNKHSVCSNKTELQDIEKELKDTKQKLLECRKHLHQLQWSEVLKNAMKNPSLESHES